MAGLPTRRLRAWETLFRQGDAGDELYVILKGRVRLSGGPGGQSVELAEGEVFGERALFEGGVRDRTAVAVVPTVLLCINRRTLDQLMKEQPATAGRILRALERPGRRAEPAGADPNSLPLKGFDETSPYLGLAAATCPLCGCRFQHETVSERHLSVEARQPDFRVKYREIEPLWYRYVVCPECLFAGRRNDFEKGPDEPAAERLRSDLAQRKSRFGVFDFTLARDGVLAVVSAQLAERCYAVWERPPLERAAVALNLYWLCEDRKDTAEARRALARATDLFIQAYRAGAGRRDLKADQRLAYLIGLLSHRLYKTKQAVLYLARAVQIGRGGDSAVMELVRELMPAVRKRQLGRPRNASEAK